jgi:hypothetical protein
MIADPNQKVWNQKCVNTLQHQRDSQTDSDKKFPKQQIRDSYGGNRPADPYFSPRGPKAFRDVVVRLIAYFEEVLRTKSNQTSSDNYRYSSRHSIFHA